MNDPLLSEKQKEIFPPNPYVIGVPLTGDSGFYGRGETFAAVEDALYAEQQNVIVLFGQRRIGKTSLLHQIARRVRITNRLVPVYFDLQGKERLALGEVLRLLTRSLARAVGMEQAFPERNDGASQFFRETFLPAVANHLGERRLLLLFDEFDVLSDDQQASPDAASFTLFPYFQELILHERQLAFIFVVGRRIEELTTSFHSIFKQAKYQRIGLLTPTEARELITQPTSGVLEYADVAIEAILTLTARHPYLTQLMCFEVFNHAKAKNARLVTAEQVHACIDSALESGHGALNWFWDGLPRAERFIMSAIAHVVHEDGVASHDDIRQILERYRIILTGLELKDAPDRLVEWDILERHGPNDYRFMIELVRIWICKQHPLDSVRRDVDYISRRAVRLFENAREAHEQDDLPYAREEYRRALQVNPNHSGAQLGLAQVEYEMGDLEAAIGDFEKAYQIDEMSARDGLVRALLERGGLHRKEGRESQALSDFEAALALAPGNEESRRAVASVFLARGDMALASGVFATAREEYRLALSRDPERDTVERVRLEMEAYAERQLASGAFAEALATIAGLQEMLGTATSTAEAVMQAWTRLGEGLLKQNRTSEALEAFERAADVAPNDISIRRRLEAVEACKAREGEIDRLLDRALASQVSEDWATAQQSCIDLIKLDCLEWRGRDIARLLVDVREQHQIANIKSAYERGRLAYALDDWVTALSIWESVDTGILSRQFSSFPQEYAYAHKQRDVSKPAPTSDVNNREKTIDAEKDTSGKRKSRSKYIWIGVSLFLFWLVFLLVYLTPPTPSQLARQLKEGDPSVRRNALEVLRGMGSEGAKVAPEVAALLKVSNGSIGGWAAYTLSKMGPEGAKFAPEVAAVLQDSNDTVRGWAAEALGNMGSEGAKFAPEVAALLKDKSSSVRTYAVIALSQMGDASTKFVPQVEALLKDGDNNVRSAATAALPSMRAAKAKSISK